MGPGGGPKQQVLCERPLGRVAARSFPAWVWCLGSSGLPTPQGVLVSAVSRQAEPGQRSRVCRKVHVRPPAAARAVALLDPTQIPCCCSTSVRNGQHWCVSPGSRNNVTHLTSLKPFLPCSFTALWGNHRSEHPCVSVKPFYSWWAVLRLLSVPILFLFMSLLDTARECVEQPQPSSEQRRLGSPASPSFPSRNI